MLDLQTTVIDVSNLAGDLKNGSGDRNASPQRTQEML